MKQQALIGTSKGLVVYNFNNPESPKMENVFFDGYSVNTVYVDKRNTRWWVGVSHKHWGQKLHYSDNEGTSWISTETPSYKGVSLIDGGIAKLKQIWTISAGGNDQKEVLWIGTEPGGLFKSEDSGNSFQLVDSLWNHPSRKDNTAWFGAGTDHPFIHSINVNPKDSQHLYVSVSCAGVFETKDGGKSWRAKNTGLMAAYLPNPNSEYGHDPHKVILHPKDINIMWQQNHCGIFLSKDGGDNWKDVSNHESLPNYGFGLVVDENEPARAWVIPVESDEKRVAPDLKLRVMRTDNYGKDWNNDSEGLPEEKAFDIVLRHAFDRSNELMVFGTTNGNLFFKRDSNDRWYKLSHHLSKINTVFIN